MENRILVIGGTGLLGEPVAHHLRRSGFKVRLMVRDIAQAAQSYGDDFELVQGDIFDQESLGKSLEGCFGVHINLSGEIEQTGVEQISTAASRLKLQRISYISGTSVAEENTWVPVIKRKFFAEQAIRDSGVPYTIFCPTWFMEVLAKFVRGKKAFVFGKQPNPYHLVAAADYARMVARSYGSDEAANKRFIIHGPESILFQDAMKQYCEIFHPEINKVSAMPHFVATIIATLKGKKEMKEASSFMNSFAKIGELGDPTEANHLLGVPKITLREWLQQKKIQ